MPRQDTLYLAPWKKKRACLSLLRSSSDPASPASAPAAIPGSGSPATPRGSQRPAFAQERAAGVSRGLGCSRRPPGFCNTEHLASLLAKSGLLPYSVCRVQPGCRSAVAVNVFCSLGQISLSLCLFLGPAVQCSVARIVGCTGLGTQFGMGAGEQGSMPTLTPVFLFRPSCGGEST